MPSSASANTAIYALSLHDALPIWTSWEKPDVQTIKPGQDYVEVADVNETEFSFGDPLLQVSVNAKGGEVSRSVAINPENYETVKSRSEEHTSELQSLRHLVCRLLLQPTRRSTLFPYTTLFRSGRAGRSRTCRRSSPARTTSRSPT